MVLVTLLLWCPINFLMLEICGVMDFQQKSLRFHQYLHLRFKDEYKSCGFGTT